MWGHNAIAQTIMAGVTKGRSRRFHQNAVPNGGNAKLSRPVRNRDLCPQLEHCQFFSELCRLFPHAIEKKAIGLA